MKRVWSTILEKTIPDNYWLKILFAITYISNLLPMSLIDGLNIYKVSTRLWLQLNYLWVLELTIYILIDQEKQMPSLLNRSLKLSKNVLGSYDVYYTYQVHLEKDDKIFYIKILKIFDVVSTKQETSLSIYNIVL